MRIGVIGDGKLGITIAGRWIASGHEVVMGAEQVAKGVGDGARLATPEEAARDGEVILLTVPASEATQFSQRARAFLRGKVVIETLAHSPEREGKNAWAWTVRQIPGSRIVHALHPARGELLEISLESDYPVALRVASRLMRDAGFEPEVQRL